ncbi:MAG: hypothetical protein QM765_47865 [Myxococcales bacterium]
MPAGRAPLTAPLRLMAGPHVLVASKPGHERQVLEVVLQPGQRLVQQVSLVTEEEAAATRKAVQEAEARRAQAQEKLLVAQKEARVLEERRQRGLRTAGWAGLGVGVGAEAAALLLVGLSRAEAGQVEGAPRDTPWSSVSKAQARSEDLRTASVVCAVSGAALLLAGGILWGLSAGEQPKVELAPAVGPKGAGLTVAGRF